MPKYSKYNLVFSFNDAYDLVYNTLFGTLALVSKEIGLAIKRGDLTPLTTTREVYEKLLSASIVLSDEVDEREILALDSREARFTSKAVSMFLSLTSRCNLACKYCYQSYRPSNEGRDLSEREWRVIHGFLERRVKTGAESIAVALYGGEPLLNPTVASRVVRDLAKLSAEHSVSVETMLITNGTVLGKEVEDVVEAVNTVQVTVDGPREVHDARRPFKGGQGSFTTILDNMAKYVDVYGKKLGLRINVDEHNIDKVVELLDLLVELGLHSKLIAVDPSPVLPDQAELYNPLKDSKNYYEYFRNIYRRIVEVLEYAVDKGFKVSRAFLRGPCMCKYVHSYAVDERLNVYMCPAYMYGEPVGAFLSEKMVVLSPERFTPVLHDPPCTDNCKYAPMCYGGCVYLQSKNVPTCLRALYGDDYLERLLRAYALTKYREVVGSA